jgi:hypothetical protein
MLKKKIWTTFQRILELFTQQIVNKLSKIRDWDPRSGKNLFQIPDPGVINAPDPDPQHRENHRTRMLKVGHALLLSLESA